MQYLFTKNNNKFINYLFMCSLLYIYNVIVKVCHLHNIADARKECLMKNKKAFGILALLLAMGLVFSSCNGKKTSSSSDSGTSSLPDSGDDGDDSGSGTPDTPLNKYTVTFKVHGVAVQTSEVEEGKLARYLGPTPTKEADAESDNYRFRGWDKDIRLPITEDTEFNALFSGYQDEILIGNFEGLKSNAELADNGWYPLGYASGGYTKETAAALSLSNYATQGSKALRFDGWANGNDYKISREFGKEELLNKACNALRFSLMVPKALTAKVILQGQISVAGTIQNAYFSHTIDVPSNEYVSYVIPFDSSRWALWGEAGKSMVEVAEWVGFHQDDVINYLTSIEFFFKGNDGAGGQKYFALLDDVAFITMNNPASSITEGLTLLSKYSSSFESVATTETVVLDIVGNAATFKIVDIPHPITVDGTVTVEGNEFKFESQDSGATLTYRGRLVDGGQGIEFLSATSSDAEFQSEIENMKFMAVQTVDNFEQYETDGQAYCVKYPDMNARSGCRGAYYSEYYNGGGYSDWGGFGWSLMGGEGDQLKLKNDYLGHNGSHQYLCMKNSSDYAMRYMQWGLFDGSAEQNGFRGTTLSFWAKTNGLIPSFKVTAYSQSKPVNASQDSNMRRLEVTDAKEEAISEWTHYEIPLHPNLTYYGFMVTMEKNNSSTSYLYIDDVEVYTASPYSRYISPYHLPTKVDYYGRGMGGINTTLRVVDDTTANLLVPAFGINLPVTYTKDDYQLTFNVNDVVTYVADISLDSKTLTFVSISGTDGVVKNLLNGLNMNITNYVENAESYTSNGFTIYQTDMDESKQSGARGAYYIDLQNGSELSEKTSPLGGEGWILPTSASMLSLNTSQKVDGNQGFTLKTSKYGNVRYMQWDLYKGTAKEVTGVDSLSLYLKSNRTVATNAKIMVYKTNRVTTANQMDTNYVVIKDISMTAKQDWTKFTVSLNPNEKYYGYAVMFMTDEMNEGNMYLDKVFYSNNVDDPEINFYASNGLVLNGTVAGSKSVQIDFKQNNNLEFTSAAMSLDHVAGTYTMEMNGSDQIMKITIGNSVITGTYSIDNTGAVTLIVTSVTGDLAAEFTGGTLTGSLVV